MSIDWLSMKPLVTVVGALLVFVFLWSIHELEDHLRPDELSLWTKIATFCLVPPTLILVWWASAEAALAYSSSMQSP